MLAFVFDTETTGLPIKRCAKIRDNGNWPYIVQCSWLVYDLDTGKIVSIKDYIVSLPGDMIVPEASSRIHGITTSIMREKGYPIKKVLEEFKKDFVRCQYIVAHNLNFDKTILRVELFRNGFPNLFKQQNYIEFCTMKYGTPICNLTQMWRGKFETKPPKLIELYEKLFNETPENLHNSLVDVFVCFRCFYKMLCGSDAFVEMPDFKVKFFSLI